MLTDEAAGGRKWIVLADQTDGIGVAAFAYQGNVTRNIHMGRAKGNARNRLRVVAGTAPLMNVLLIVFTAFF
mgnify:CR=1 FL=1